jgi:photosystem II stability/assembly factor-like uncharacterized protein
MTRSAAATHRHVSPQLNDRVPAAADDVWIGTRGDGVQRLRAGALEPRGPAGEDITALYARDDVLLAGSYGNGLFRSDDGGESWLRVDAGLTAPALRCFAEEPGGGLLAGTEPARMFRSDDRGASWSELDGVTRIEGHERWFLPYSPRAGAVRNIHATPGRLLASVEVGGLLRSEDGGATWTCEPIIAAEDIHVITGHPDDPDRLFAALGTASVTRRGGGRLGGVARSRDGGASWEKVENEYTRAVIVPPARPDLLLAAPALRVGASGRIVVSPDQGDTWEPASAGVEVPMPDMVERFVAAPGGDVWAICSRGRLLRATPGEWSWDSVLPDRLQARSVAFSGVRAP